MYICTLFHTRNYQQNNLLSYIENSQQIEQSEKHFFDIIPVEIIQHILYINQDFRSLLSFKITCKKIKKLIENDFLFTTIELLEKLDFCIERGTLVRLSQLKYGKDKKNEIKFSYIQLRVGRDLLYIKKTCIGIIYNFNINKSVLQFTNTKSSTKEMYIRIFFKSAFYLKLSHCSEKNFLLLTVVNLNKDKEFLKIVLSETYKYLKTGNISSYILLDVLVLISEKCNKEFLKIVLSETYKYLKTGNISEQTFTQSFHLLKIFRTMIEHNKDEDLLKVIADDGFEYLISRKMSKKDYITLTKLLSGKTDKEIAIENLRVIEEKSRRRKVMAQMLIVTHNSKIS